MTLRPATREELATQLALASSSREKIGMIDFSLLNAVVEHAPEDMTATVQAGVTLATFQEVLRRAGQWLPLDPAHGEKLTIADLLAFDRSGPRRLGYGTPRDHLIGVQVALANGQLIKAGGKVVKNVAGYDLCKLFVGARHSLGIIVEATFKLRPLPEVQRCVAKSAASLAEVRQVARALLDSNADPVLLDAHNLGGRLILVAAFAGMREDVEAQVDLARSLGFQTDNATDYFETFWNGAAPQKRSVLPSRTVETIEKLAPAEFVAHLGNGIIYFRGGPAAAETPVAGQLMNRVKKTYDPHEILPAFA